jgi:hypothetical protein
MLSLSISIIVGFVPTLLSSLMGRLLQEKQPGENIVGALKSVNLLTREQSIAALYNFLLFVMMIAGILANYFWVNGFGSSLDLTKFWKRIVISPIIFLVVYVEAAKQARGLVPVLVAFQNGFFWQTILAGAGPSQHG